MFYCHKCNSWAQPKEQYDSCKCGRLKVFDSYTDYKQLKPTNVNTKTNP